MSKKMKWNKCETCNINWCQSPYTICYLCTFPNNCEKCEKPIKEKFKICYKCKMGMEPGDVGDVETDKEFDGI